MSAWLAMMAATVERTTAKGRRPSGSIWKKGLRSGMAWSSAVPELESSHAPWPM